MKPLKGATGLSTWILRIALVVFVFVAFKTEIFGLNFSDLNAILILILAVFSALLLIGGFLRKHSLTVISGLLIFILALVLLVILALKDGFGLDEATFLLLASVGLFFAAYGNK